jgi:hypothetical protein
MKKLLLVFMIVISFAQQVTAGTDDGEVPSRTDEVDFRSICQYSIIEDLSIRCADAIQMCKKRLQEIQQQEAQQQEVQQQEAIQKEQEETQKWYEEVQKLRQKNYRKKINKTFLTIDVCNIFKSSEGKDLFKNSFLWTEKRSDVSAHIVKTYKMNRE